MDKATLIVFSTLLIVFGVIFAALFAMLIPLLNAERQHVEEFQDRQQREQQREDCNDMMLGDRLWNKGYVFAVAKHCFEFFNLSLDLDDIKK